MQKKQGCLAGIGEIFLLRWLFDWLQQKFGYRSGTCMGCGCGVILAIFFVIILFSIVFGTDWLRLW